MIQPDYNELMEECCRIAMIVDRRVTRPYVGSLIWYDGKIISVGHVASTTKKVKKKKEVRRGGRSGSRGSSAQVGRRIEEKNVRIHSEQMSLSNLATADLYDIRKSVLVTTLEPCIPGSRTGPRRGSLASCCELIVEYGIKRVVIGRLDSSNKVPGYSGVLYLRENGIEVIHNEHLEKLVRDTNANYVDFRD